MCAHHVGNQTHLTGRGGNVVQFGECHLFVGFFPSGRREFSFSHPLYFVLFFQNDWIDGPLFLFLVAGMTAEGACGGEFAEFVTYHVFGDVDRE